MTKGAGMRRGTAVAIAAVVIIAVLAGMAVATHSSTGVFSACYSQRNGTVKLINEPGLPTTCGAGNVPFSFNQQGQPGSDGASAGYAYLLENTQIGDSGVSDIAFLDLPAGSFLLNWSAYYENNAANGELRCVLHTSGEGDKPTVRAFVFPNGYTGLAGSGFETQGGFRVALNCEEMQAGMEGRLWHIVLTATQVQDLHIQDPNA